MNTSAVQNQFGYFGKLPTFGDFIHQLLPQDFANSFHAWLQQAMAAARGRLGDDFLPAYLNCPAWKFALKAGVCGEQPVAGVTIPSVDRVGRYFNFTLATVLEPGANPLAYVLGNNKGFAELENTALDILEADCTKEDLEMRVRGVAPRFDSVDAASARVENEPSALVLTMDRPLPFAGRAAALMDQLLARDLGSYGVWWSGQQGQDSGQMILSRGMPADETYLKFLLREDSGLDTGQPEESYVDRIIAGES